VPPQQRLGADRYHAPRGARQAPAQVGQDEPVTRLPGGALDPTPEDADLVPQRQQLDVPRPVALAAEQGQVGELTDQGAQDR
jgi:hypothetical protein